MNEGKARGVPDLLLCERDYHLLNAVAGPLGPMAREQFKKKVRDALSRGATKMSQTGMNVEAVAGLSSRGECDGTGALQLREIVRRQRLPFQEQLRA